MSEKHQPPSRTADQFMIRFERAGQREELKREAEREKRSLNKHLLLLIERGQRGKQADQQPATQGATQ